MRIELITICTLLLTSTTGQGAHAMGKPAPEAAPIFNSCSCEVTKSRSPFDEHGWGELAVTLQGRSFVKAADGSVSKQETSLGQWIGPYRSIVQYEKCEKERRNQEMAFVCPKTESSDEK